MIRESLLEMGKQVAESLGGELVIATARSLEDSYSRGEPLTYKELRALTKGSVVWARYREWLSTEYVADGPYRIKKDEDLDAWYLDDGSSFALEFAPEESDPQDDEDECTVLDDEAGVIELFLAEEMVPEVPAEVPPTRDVASSSFEVPVPEAPLPAPEVQLPEPPKPEAAEPHPPWNGTLNGLRKVAKKAVKRIRRKRKVVAKASSKGRRGTRKKVRGKGGRR